MNENVLDNGEIQVKSLNIRHHLAMVKQLGL
jgi:hypothetical protein